MEIIDTARQEASVRRLARTRGLRVRKSRAEHGFTSLHYSGPRYMVIRVWDNRVIDWGPLDQVRKNIEGGLVGSPFPDVTY